MAYKFQLGNAIMSGSLTQKEGLNAGDDGLSNAGAIAGATTITATGIISSSADVKAAQLYIQDVVVIDNLADVYVNNINGNGTLSLNDGTNTVSNTELLILSGATVSTAELNILDNADSSINTLSLPDNTTISTYGASLIDDTDAATARGTLGLDTSDNVEFNDLTLNGDLIVLGSTFSASVGTLLIEDALINIGDGQASYADGYGIEFGTSGSSWASLKTAQVNSANHLSSSLPLAASSFYGDGSNLTGVSIVLNINEIGDTDATLAIGVNVANANTTTTRTWTLPASPSAGQSVKVKVAGVSSGAITVQGAGSQTIDGTASSILLESDNAAVELIYVADDDWRVF